MNSKINVYDIKDIEIDGFCMKNDNACSHDVTIIYKNGVVKGKTFDFYYIKYLLYTLGKIHSHFN